MTRRLIGSGLLTLGLSCAAMTAADELVGDPHWEYRLPDGAWTTNAPGPVQWPSSWRTFTRWDYETDTPPHDDDPRAFTNVPAALTFNGISACRASLPNYGPGVLDLTVGQGAPRTGLWAYVFGQVTASRDAEVVMHTAASGRVEFWLNGQPVTGPVRLNKGDHVLAGRVSSSAKDWFLAGCFAPVGTEVRRVTPPPSPVPMPARVLWPTGLSQPPATVALVGDPQSGPPWRDIARALATAKPDAMIIIGDLVKDGLSPTGWNKTFFEPASTALTNIPWLAVMGNHDRQSPLLERFGGAKWTREIGGALFVGIDGGLDWSPGGDHARWLEHVLGAASNRFKFVISHYPAYSSRNHGKLADDGRVLERPTRIARTQILPLLENYRVTALLAGHDHGYERSELPGGLTHIVTAGGGAGLYPVHENGRANPFSTKLVDQHHYSLLRLEGADAVFTAVTADGTVIDSRTWKGRTP
jgi:hypothetical protein